jgi:DNA-binding XRE family transcriptional regulator
MWTKEAGQHLKKMRELAGYTQKELAKAIGYKSEKIISLVETGKREPSGKFRGRVLKAIRKKLRWVEMRDIFLDSVVNSATISLDERHHSDTSHTPHPEKSSQKPTDCVLGGKSG